MVGGRSKGRGWREGGREEQGKGMEGGAREGDGGRVRGRSKGVICVAAQFQTWFANCSTDYKLVTRLKWARDM